MPTITNDDGTPLSPADLLELGDLIQHPALLGTGVNDRPAMPCPTADQLQALLAEPTPLDQQDFWAEHAMGTARLASFTSPADDD